MTSKRKPIIGKIQKESKIEAPYIDTTPEGPIRGDLVALFRLLLKEPPSGHDFKTCPICKEYGIKGI